ncbi:MAG: ATP-binding protein, partial [Candidatus Binatia bacterium]
GTGKSLWIRETMPDAACIDLLDPEALRNYSARPERLREFVDGHPSARAIVIDEVQQVPDLLPLVHSLIEAKRRRRFVLTGSSARKLKRAGVDLLAGRATWRSLHPFMAAELGARFDLESALRLGLLPLVVAADDPAEALRGYIALYLREEVQLEGLVRNLGSFARFLEAISSSHGAVLNLSAVSRECQVERKTVEAYVAILEDLLLAFRVPVFTRRARRAVTTHPKLYLFDAGIYRSLRPAGPLDRPQEIDGAALEGLVAQHLRAWIGYRSGAEELFFWRTRAGVEVDFIVYGKSGLWAIEVKHAGRVRREDWRGLAAFRQAYPQSRCFLLYRGAERLRTEGIWCLPVEQFLAAVRPDRLIGEGL